MHHRIKKIGKKFLKSIRKGVPILGVKLRKIGKKGVRLLKLLGRMARNFPPLFIFEFRRDRRFRRRVFYGISAIILLLLVMQVPRWYKQFKFRTHFISNQDDILPVSEDIAKKDIDGKCDDIRKNAPKLYSVSEISDAIAQSNGGKVTLVGEDEPQDGSEEENTAPLVLDTSGKDIQLLCFSFQQAVIVTGSGSLDIGLNDFESVPGSALVMEGAKGTIHQNIIENAQKAGIFADSGQWEISENVIKNNLSYGVYGGYGADLHLNGNFIGGNGGYQIRLLAKREVYK